MKVGLLGYGTVGGGVAEILQGGVEGLELKRILRRKYQQEQIY